MVLTGTECAATCDGVWEATAWTKASEALWAAQASFTLAVGHIQALVELSNKYFKTTMVQP